MFATALRAFMATMPPGARPDVQHLACALAASLATAVDATLATAGRAAAVFAVTDALLHRLLPTSSAPTDFLRARQESAPALPRAPASPQTLLVEEAEPVLVEEAAPPDSKSRRSKKKRARAKKLALDKTEPSSKGDPELPEKVSKEVEKKTEIPEEASEEVEKKPEIPEEASEEVEKKPEIPEEASEEVEQPQFPGKLPEGVEKKKESSKKKSEESPKAAPANKKPRKPEIKAPSTVTTGRFPPAEKKVAPVGKNPTRAERKPTGKQPLPANKKAEEEVPAGQTKSKRRRAKKSERKMAAQLKDPAPRQTTLPLELFQQLQLGPRALHTALHPLLLRPQQLLELGFPREGQPPPPMPDDPNERRCCRCGAAFYITTDGHYQAADGCRFHSGKMTTLQGIPGAGPYACCNGDYLSAGCTRHRYHVTVQPFPWIDETPLVRTRRLSRSPYASVFALDCEMCYTTHGLEVARVALVGADGAALLDTLVRPRHRVLDYNTVYSGVSERTLRGVRTTLREVQLMLLRLLDCDSILVGHALDNDLRALRLVHERVVDTSVAYPHPHGEHLKRSLKSLAAEFLDKTIQEDAGGHDCVDDARTSMELILLKVQEQRKALAGHRCAAPFGDGQLYLGSFYPGMMLACCCRE